MKKKTMKVMALLLAAVMAVTPASTSYAAQDTGAAEATVEASSEAADIVSDTIDDTASTEESEKTDVVESVENIEEPDATDETESTEETDTTEESDSVEETQPGQGEDSENGEVTDGTEEGEITDGTENTGDGEVTDGDGSENEVPDDSVSDNAPEEGTESDGTVSGNTPEDGTVSDNTVSENTVSENTVSENEVDALFPGMPEGYTLTSAQEAGKKELSSYLEEIDELEEGMHYIPRELVYSTDSEEEAQMVANAYGGELASYFEGVAVIKLPEKVTVSEALYAAADVTMKLPAVWPNYYRYEFAEEAAVRPAGYGVNDPFLEVNHAQYQWQHYAVGSMYAWNAGYKGQGITVAVIDSGIDATHVELKDKIVGQYNAISNTENSAPDESTGSGHGTHVAGIIGAKGNNALGGSGIAPEAKIYAIKALGAAEGAGSSATIARAVNHAVAKGADVINMSLGGVGYGADERLAVASAVDAGVAVFVAAGNDGSKTKCYPAAFPEVICVAATDRNNARASFSNYGSWVDLCGPGVDIYSTLPPQVTQNGKLVTTGGYGIMSGTSQATPVIAGTAAVILSSNPKALEGKSGKDKVVALEKLMKSGVTKASGGSMGSGVVNLPKALKIPGVAAKPAKPVFSVAGGTITEKEVTTAISTTVDCELYYSVDGKTPALKNGVVINAVKATSNLQNVTVNGIVNGKVTGKATVKAMAVNKYTQLAGPVATGTYTFKPKVEAVTITGATTKVPAGKSLSLKAAVTPAYAANKAVTWSISPNEKANGVSITTSGVVKTTRTAVPGTYTVTATPQDGLGGTPGTYTVTVTGADSQSTLIKSIKFNPTKVSLQMKDTPVTHNMADGMTALKADNTPAVAADFIWSSSKPAVATVDSTTGVVTTVGAGTTVITALAADGSGVKKTCTVAVEQLATGIEITQPVDKTNVTTVQLAAGKSVALKANVLPITTKNKAVMWTITGDSKATGVSVSQTSGKVTAKTTAVPGNYTVTATAKNDSTVVDTIEVIVVKGAATKVTLDKKAVTLFREATVYNAPQTANITVTSVGADGYVTDYTVTSSNENIVTAVKNGNIVTVQATGKAIGTSTIKVVMNDGSGKSATCKVTVKNPASNILIAPEAGRTPYIGKGKTLKLSAVYEEEFGKATKKVNWKVLSGAEYAKVDGSGKVTALKKGGSAQIQAEAADGSGLKATYTVYTFNAITGIKLVPTKEVDGVYEITVLYKSDAVSYYVPYDQLNLAGIYPEINIEVSSPDQIAIDNSYAYGRFRVYMVDFGTTTVTVKAMDGSNKKESVRFRVTR